MDRENLTAEFVKNSGDEEFKCVVNLDGYSASWGLARRMVGGHVILKQDSHFVEHFYHLLEEGKNYILVRTKNYL